MVGRQISSAHADVANLNGVRDNAIASLYYMFGGPSQPSFQQQHSMTDVCHT